MNAKYDFHMERLTKKQNTPVATAFSEHWLLISHCALFIDRVSSNPCAIDDASEAWQSHTTYPRSQGELAELGSEPTSVGL